MPWDPRRMGFFEHLDEFRRRFSVVLAVVFLGAIVAYFFSDEVIAFLVAPLELTQKLKFFSPMEAFTLHFKVGVFASIVATSPVWLYELLAFVTPALKPRERRWFFPGLVALVFFFILGNVFCYLFFLKAGFGWMMDQAGRTMEALPRASDYVNFVTYFLLGFGLAFETPVIVFVLVKLGVIEADALFRQWRWALITIMLVASIATPDWSPVTMLLLAGSMLVLYFGAALVAKLTTRRRRDEDPDEPDMGDAELADT